ncbi:hypothetical protein Tco_1017818 [Tanacetum coccineum]|uniref:Uncharacterized protein n=1 Tax=Tanacetum coccineum TaxID=301880 RepID=A0ABQ5FTZ4_9ASTR
MQDLTATFDNIVQKLSQEDQEGTNEAAVKEGMNDVVQEEMIGVGHDSDYDASISGNTTRNRRTGDGLFLGDIYH